MSDLSTFSAETDQLIPCTDNNPLKIRAREQRTHSLKSRFNFFKDASWEITGFRDGLIGEDDSVISTLSGLTTNLESEDGSSKSAPASQAPSSMEAFVMISSRYYVVMGSIGASTRIMVPTRIVVDTGRLQRHSARRAAPYWEKHIVQDASLPDMGDANGHLLLIRHEVRLHIRLLSLIGDGVYTAKFLIVNQLACPVLIGTQFLHKHVDAIKFRQRLIYLTRSITPILGVGDFSAPYKEEDPFKESAMQSHATQPKQRPLKNSPAAAHIRLCRPLRLPPYTQVKAQVVAESGGLVHAEPKQSVWGGYKVRAINGIHEFQPNQPFELLLGNFSRTERRFLKGMVIAYAAPTPLAIISLEGQDSCEMAQILNIVPLENPP